MIFMEQARIYVDLNERIDKDIFLLSKGKRLIIRCLHLTAGR